jgi:acyl phosphate:glycerol-3-phosphate acyltransferase
MIVVQLIAVAVIGYLLGSIPFGLIVSKMQARVDIRDYGSGRTGGTNVLRTLGRKAFVLVAVGDVGKAATAVLLASLIIGHGYIPIGSYHLGRTAAQSLAGICAIMGHIFPVFARFKGGRGVATFIGGLAVLSPVAALLGGEILLMSAGLSGFASLGSIVGVMSAYAIMIPLTIVFGVPVEYLAYVLFGVLVIIIAHKDNIKRLLSGKERKLNQKATPTSNPA